MCFVLLLTGKSKEFYGARLNISSFFCHWLVCLGRDPIPPDCQPEVGCEAVTICVVYIVSDGKHEKTERAAHRMDSYSTRHAVSDV